jgi:hypothetical protein
MSAEAPSRHGARAPPPFQLRLLLQSRAAPRGGVGGEGMLPVSDSAFTIQIPPFTTTGEAHVQLLEASRVAMGDLNMHAL